MNVEVEVVREIRTTYLILGAKSLEDAERRAEECEAFGGQSSGCVRGEPREDAPYVAWSEPVIVREGQVVR